MDLELKLFLKLSLCLETYEAWPLPVKEENRTRHTAYIDGLCAVLPAERSQAYNF
jgi:hypothetical protein